MKMLTKKEKKEETGRTALKRRKKMDRKEVLKIRETEQVLISFAVVIVCDKSYLGSTVLS